MHAQQASTAPSPDQRELRVEEGDVERGVVNDQLGTADEVEQFGGDLPELRLVLQELGSQAMHLERARVALPLGIEVVVEVAICQPAVDELHGADLDDPVARA